MSFAHLLFHVGVPQGSVLGPFTFFSFSISLADFFHSQGSKNCVASDPQSINQTRIHRSKCLLGIYLTSHRAYQNYYVLKRTQYKICLNSCCCISANDPSTYPFFHMISLGTVTGSFLFLISNTYSSPPSLVPST